MEQDTQTSENNNQVDNGVLFRKPKKKSSKKIVLLVGAIVVILGVVASYFLFFSDKKDENVPVLEDEKSEEVEIDKELDSDQDGLPNYIEKVLGTDVNNSDTDGDGYSDFEEIKNGYNPLSDEKYTEEEWEEVKEEIRNEDEEFYGSIFNFYNLNKIDEALSACQKNKNDDGRIYCEAMINGESSICENRPDVTSREICYHSMAVTTKNVSLCEKAGSKNACLAALTLDYEKCKMVDLKDNCYMNIAILTKDFSGCERISDKMVFNECSAYTKLDISLCERLEETKKEYCYADVAKRKRDSSLCDAIQSDKKEMCIAIADRNKEGLDCVKYPTECTYFASMTKDASICNLIPAKDYSYSAFKDNCYLSVAEHILANL